MRAVQITQLTGPDGLELVETAEPGLTHPLASGPGVLIEVHAAGVSFPDLLQTRGQYQIQPELPFVPGSEVSGIVRSAPAGAAVRQGDRVAAYCLLGGYAQLAVAPEFLTYAIPAEWDDAQGAAFVLNYHTAYFSLVTRGRLSPGETVLVHGAAGGVGTAALQIAKALGARTIAVVSSDEKQAVARQAGADEVLRSQGPWKDQATALGGVEMVIDPVGGDRFIDSLRSLKAGGRLVVVGFSAGSIPEVKVNRLLLNNVAVVGSGWGATMARADVNRQIHNGLGPLIAAGHIRPIVGARFALEQAGDALKLIEQRGATGKVVLEMAAATAPQELRGDRHRTKLSNPAQA
jgi:NADPH2:quinone reductase